MKTKYVISSNEYIGLWFIVDISKGNEKLIAIAESDEDAMTKLIEHVNNLKKR